METKFNCCSDNLTPLPENFECGNIQLQPSIMLTQEQAQQLQKDGELIITNQLGHQMKIIYRPQEHRKRKKAAAYSAKPEKEEKQIYINNQKPRR